MSVQIVYETHSVTTDNEAGIATGWLPGALSPQGRALAQQLGERRAADRFAAIFVSDLRRAVETAEIAFGRSGIPTYLDPRLRECDYGELNGALAATVSAQRCARVDTPFPGGESYQQVVDRTEEFLRELVRDWDGARVLVIAHSANRWALEHLLNGRSLAQLAAAPYDWQEGWHFRVPAGWAGRGQLVRG
ncbi:MAG TPA: histidine phosphatase family protein [Pilimelia sp.]|nr:histidine phosphatase family protein [Pilimelia sp.]